MGVHGLTTYLRENKRILSEQIVLTSTSQPPGSVPSMNAVENPPKQDVRLVVDGWSFIYELYRSSSLPWVYGGEYFEFAALVEEVVEAWRSLGMELHFVFDGPYPELKFPTLISRASQSVIQPSLLFFRTSATSRSAARFLNETRILPRLCLSACLQALFRLQARLHPQTSLNGVSEGKHRPSALHIHFADSEADPYAIELAARIHGYVVGLDSDFIVLNKEGYEGYVPIDEMVWIATADEEDDKPDENDGEFQTVKNSRKKKAQKISRGRLGLIPPNESGNDPSLTLTFAVYKPSALATHLQIPVTILPLLGALVGNDYNNVHSLFNSTTYPLSSGPPTNKRIIQHLFFDRHMSSTQRITHVASTLHSILSAAAPTSPNRKKPKQKNQVNSVMDLIDRTVSALLPRGADSLSSGEQESIVEKIVEATLIYAIPHYAGGEGNLWPTEVCPLHDPEACPLFVMLHPTLHTELGPVDSDIGIVDEAGEEIRALYIDAYRRGKLSPRIMDVMSTKTFWPRHFLEDMDLEGTTRSIGRGLRVFVYAVLDEGLGIPEDIPEEEEVEEEGSDDEEDEDELIDVVEEHSDDGEDGEPDPLAPLQNAIHRLESGGSDSGSAYGPPPSTSSHTRSHRATRPVVVEYVRRGTRLAAEEVTVAPLTSLISLHGDMDLTVPVQLMSEDHRLGIFFSATKSDMPSVRSLSRHLTMAVVTVRWVVQCMHTRAVDSGGIWEKQKERWTKGEARAFLASFNCSSGSQPEAPESQLPPIENRNIQLTAQTTAALEAMEHLSQVLLLTERLPSPVPLFSGKRFHSLLTGTTPLNPADVPEPVWKACSDGLEDAFVEEKAKKGKRDRKAKQTTIIPPAPAITKKTSSQGGFFGLLADVDA